MTEKIPFVCIGCGKTVDAEMNSDEAAYLRCSKCLKKFKKERRRSSSLSSSSSSPRMTRKR